MSGSSRRCGTCRWFKDAGMGGTGWCTHPKRQTSSDVRILVRKAELACRNSWGEDFWEALDASDAPSEPARPAPAPAAADPNDMSIQISFEDEVTSVVDADIHRAITREDIDDRMVEEANLDPDDEEDAGDDRFGLLARGGRDSVNEARNRMLRRRGGNLDLPEDDAPHPRHSDHARFAPDDFVEEEGPAPSKAEPSQDISPFDDVILSENLPQGSPRSRRIRRERDRQTRPKTRAVVETSPDVPAPANTPGAADHSIGDPFNTVPEIASDIDISTLRKHRPTGEPRAHHRSPAEPSRENAYEEDIRSAQAIRAAARAEREGRHRQARRPQVMPRSNATPAVQHDDASSVIAELVQSALARQNTLDQHAASDEAAPVRTRVSTRSFDDTPMIAEQPRMSAASVEHADVARPDDPRASWWRGMFQPRQKIETRSYPVEADDMIEDESESISFAFDTAFEPDEPVARAQPALRSAPEPLASVADVQDERYDDEQPVAVPAYAPVDLEADSGMESFRKRLFGRPDTRQESRAAGPGAQLAAEDLLDDPADAWYEPDPVPAFDLRRIVEEAPVLLDMTIEIAPEVPRHCASCRSYRQYEKETRGWCTNNWAFTHRQMVNATDLACDSTIGCWWLPADKEVWLDDSEPVRKGTPRIDRLIAHLDPLKKVVGH